LFSFVGQIGFNASVLNSVLKFLNIYNPVVVTWFRRYRPLNKVYNLCAVVTLLCD
jgi:hypothetical protein